MKRSIRVSLSLSKNLSKVLMSVASVVSCIRLAIPSVDDTFREVFLCSASVFLSFCSVASGAVIRIKLEESFKRYCRNSTEHFEDFHDVCTVQLWVSRHFLDRQILDSQILDRHFLDSQILDRQFLDRQILDCQILDRHFLDRFLITSLEVGPLKCS